MKTSNLQLVLLRLAIGALFLTIGLEKYSEGWLTNAAPLTESLQRYAEHPGSLQGVYLRTVALPLASFWSKAILLGELALGASLLLGLLVRSSSLAGVFMVVNLQAANGNLFSWSLFSSPWGAMLIAGLVAMFLSRAGRWAGLDAALARLNGRSAFW